MTEPLELPKESDPVVALLAIMARLRDPQCGCPWDLAQSFATIAPYTIEEAYEVADTIESAEAHEGSGTREGRGAVGCSGAVEGRGAVDAERLKDELGDLLFQVVFHARLAEERGWFGFADVARAIAEKLTRRHPHIFGEQALAVDTASLNRRWEEHKAQERDAAARRRGEQHAGMLADVPLALPALRRAEKLGKRAGRVGFDWKSAAEVREKVLEELSELDAAIAGTESGEAHIAEELGDLLFAVANWARHLEIDAETALRAANAKFERRFAAMERVARERGRALSALSAAEWDALWREVKATA